MKRFFICLLLLFAYHVKAQNPYNKVIAITTTVNATNGSIKLTWNKIPSATGYTVSRKLRNSSTWTNLASLTNNSDTTYTDIIPNPLVGYEYQVVTTGTGIEASGYVYAAINLPANHYVGRLILLIDSAYINYCSQEINQYTQDIIKEGWSYSIQYVSRTMPVTGVKQIIKTIYEQDPTNTKGVFILGHIAVPYSGDIFPDGHPDHEGAWPTDGYYADINSSEWTDNSINITVATRPENRNVPGDGKFDQSSLNPANVKLFVTRVDLFGMASINNNDSILIKNYLLKNHAYRSLQKKFRMRALVDDNFGYAGGEAFAQNGYRNGVTLLGKDSVMDGDYFTSMNTIANSFLWSYGCGAGSYTGALGVGSTSDFKTTDVQSVFTMLFGSYFGDWDNPDNFLRAPLARNSSILTNCWAGRPNWFFHGMGLGEYIGLTVYAQLKTPAAYIPFRSVHNLIHTELLGDPTLKMYLYEPPRNLIVKNENYAVNISWSASADVAVTGYYIYRSASLAGPFTLLNANPVSSLNFTDNSAPAGMNLYMVRAVKLQNTISSGTFNNLSNGIIDSITVLAPLPIQVADFTLHNKGCTIDLEWNTVNDKNVDHYEVLFSTDTVQYTSLRKIAATNAGNYTTTHEQVCTLYEDKTMYYKLKIVDVNGRFAFSNVLTTEIKNTRQFSISENPVIHHLTIKGLKEPGSIRIVDMNGKVIFKQDVNQESVIMNASFLNSGIYFLQYFNKDNASTLKFFKK